MQKNPADPADGRIGRAETEKRLLDTITISAPFASPWRGTVSALCAAHQRPVRRASDEWARCRPFGPLRERAEGQSSRLRSKRGT